MIWSYCLRCNLSSLGKLTLLIVIFFPILLWFFLPVFQGEIISLTPVCLIKHWTPSGKESLSKGKNPFHCQQFSSEKRPWTQHMRPCIIHFFFWFGKLFYVIRTFGAIFNDTKVSSLSKSSFSCCQPMGLAEYASDRTDKKSLIKPLI